MMEEPNHRTYLSFKLVLQLCLSFMVVLSKHSSVSHSYDQDASTQELLDEAFEEQPLGLVICTVVQFLQIHKGYYLQRLFLEYGSNGTLTYEGLHKLLGSLGLGEISVLEIRHGVVKNSSPSPSHSHPHSYVDHHHHPHQASSTATLNKLSQHEAIRPKETMSSAETDVASGSAGGEDHSHPSHTASPGTEERLQDGLSLLSSHITKKHIHDNCLNVTQLLWNFGLGEASHITPAHFTFLCPALLYQIDSGVCLRHTESDLEEVKNSVAFLKALGWASLALFVISLPSLLALGLAPLIPPSSLHTFLCPMAAMAVGTLCGDALLHLLPHASSGPHSDHQDAVLKGLSVLGGVYLLFVFESVVRLRQHYKKSRKRKQDAKVVQELEVLEAGSSPPEHTVSSESGHGHSHAHSHAPPARESSGLSSVAWMVVMGDGIHNLTDGLAIGVAFSQSLTGGLSTTIAVFCHELPHELGDLAVLLAAGWPVRRLAVFSVLSALLGYVGVLGGTVLGHQWAQHSPWILTITAGVFLYVALADVMPEMLHGERGSMGPLKRFLLQCAGLLVGGIIMLCIALFEEDIAVSMGDG